MREEVIEVRDYRYNGLEISKDGSNQNLLRMVSD